ncbi:DISARM system SNF2-like helicase DrmD [Solicola gregarius]|uniref:DISARM system SNF2-like helicase DrmD n=1 Tax=Solicola gregarius TaxID=2908642 RepID=A0AA46YKG6_9ACTN|nr:DISARM system SNF2-like helicase DrmD [Solicola gregarius]UYM05487.1 DISARM system SNF2-like helicase DrmD [Solicola gregarius]UYM05519.1 DISARM system SNF2-like helicase DrmD [Solicola gregarius]
MTAREHTTATAVPEPGQIVSVRGANWAVADVQQQSLPRSAQDDAVQQLQHAVTLQSVEDDRLGEELRVVWELEPGRSLTPPQDLPTDLVPERFDDPARLAAFIDALRWGALTSADDKTIQAPFRSGANVEHYQLEPLVRALREPRVNLLLADDVGLGKTIEAGLVMQELFLRHRARTAIVVCPAGLRIKWQEEMAEKFGLEFTIMNSETMREVRRSHGVHANPFTLFPRIIVSMSWLPGARAQRQLRDAFHAHERDASRFAYDILVVDEAHHVAPSAPTRRDKVGRTRGYAVDSLRTRAVRDLAERCEHRLFLSATPHNGYTESFTALLEMIDPQRFVRGTALDEKALEQVAVRRLKDDIPGRFVKREVKALDYAPTDKESEAYERLLEFTRRRDNAVARADGSRAAKDMATLLLKKRFLSSPVAFARTVDIYRETRAGDLPVDFDSLYDEVVGTDSDGAEEGRVEQPEMQTLQKTKNALPPLSDEDTEDLEWLSTWGHRYDARPDARLESLIAYLEAACRPDGQWNNERVVVFTEYVDTLDWIRDILRQKGWESERIDVIAGGTDSDERELIRDRFNEDPAKEPIRILWATDAAGEGIDLQNYCHRLVNFDIPFNPNRLEQRIGRVDRYGQQIPPEIRHFTASTDATDELAADVEMLARVARRVSQIMRDLGSANEIIAPDIQRQLGGVDVAAPSVRAEKDPMGKMLSGGRGLGTELTKLADELTSSRKTLHLRPANLQRVVETAFELDRIPELEEVGSEYTDVPVLRLPSLDQSWEQVTRGLSTRLDPDNLRPIAFDPRVLAPRDEGGDPDVVYQHLGSPLLQRATKRLRAAIWGTERSLERVTAVVVPELRESFAAAVTRMVLIGDAGLRVHEEVFLAGTRLARRQALGEEKSEALLERALDSDKLERPSDVVIRQIASAWSSDTADGLRARVAAAVEDRVARRRRDIEQQLTARHEADHDRVIAIFDRFGHTLEEALREARELADDDQLALFTDERRQSERDLAQIRERIQALAEERERELAAVDARYADVKARTFHAAVVFALSPEDAASGEVTIR